MKLVAHSKRRKTHLSTVGLFSWLIDLTILAKNFELLLCPICNSNVVVEEYVQSKMGFATALRICCTKSTCKFSKAFYTKKEWPNLQIYAKKLITKDCISRRIRIVTRLNEEEKPLETRRRDILSNLWKMKDPSTNLGHFRLLGL